MNFLDLIARKEQTVKSMIKLIEDYKGRNKGFIFKERRASLKRKAQNLNDKIDNYGKDNIYKWTGTYEENISCDQSIIRGFEVIMAIEGTTEATAFIEYKTGGKVLHINKVIINIGILIS